MLHHLQNFFKKEYQNHYQRFFLIISIVLKYFISVSTFSKKSVSIKHQILTRQLPVYLLNNSDKFFLFLIIVIFAIPPILRKQTGKSIFFCKEIKWWKIGVNGAPCPPFKMSLFLKLNITFLFVNWLNSFPFPICLDTFSFGLWKIVWPWKPIIDSSLIFNSSIILAWKIVMPLSKLLISFVGF